MLRTVLLLALSAGLLLAAPALAAPTPVKPSKEFTGSVDDEKLQKDAPEVITSVKDLEKVWKAWGVKDKMPDVDFTKEIVLTTTRRGSKLSLMPSLDEKGDLKALGFGTKDLRPGFRYVIAVVGRDGVKTVNGKELPKE